MIERLKVASKIKHNNNRKVILEDKQTDLLMKATQHKVIRRQFNYMQLDVKKLKETQNIKQLRRSGSLKALNILKTKQFNSS